MVVNYLGGGSFKFQSGTTSLLLNPESARFKADATLRTLVAADLAGVEPGDISFAGEYEIKGIEVRGFAVSEESTERFLKTVYLVVWEGIKFALLGHISKPLPANIVEELSEPDVAVLPVGGGHFLEPEIAARVAKQIEPSFIVPSFYKNPADFLKAMGQKAEPEDKLVFKKKDLGELKNKVVVLKA